jgi:hypothetical protein
MEIKLTEEEFYIIKNSLFNYYNNILKDVNKRKKNSIIEKELNLIRKNNVEELILRFQSQP